MAGGTFVHVELLPSLARGRGAGVEHLLIAVEAVGANGLYDVHFRLCALPDIRSNKYLF
jgi:hypothetical protein